MNTCKIAKINATVNNVTLYKLGRQVVTLTSTGTTYSSIVFYKTSAASNYTINVISGTVYSNTACTTAYGSSITISTNSDNYLYFKKGTTISLNYDKYNIGGIIVNNATLSNQLCLSDLAYSTTFTKLDVQRNSRVHGTIEYFTEIQCLIGRTSGTVTFHVDTISALTFNGTRITQLTITYSSSGANISNENGTKIGTYVKSTNKWTYS